jgi:hypothetical protein
MKDLVAGADEPVQEGFGDDRIGEQRVPVIRGIGRDGHGAALLAVGEDLEQQQSVGGAGGSGSWRPVR